MWIVFGIACEGNYLRRRSKTEDTSKIDQTTDTSSEPSDPTDEEPIESIEQRLVYTTIRNGGGGGVYIYSPQRRSGLEYRQFQRQTLARCTAVRGRSKDLCIRRQSFLTCRALQLLVFDQSGLVEEHFFRSFHHTIAVHQDAEGEMIFTLEQEFIGQDPVVITDKVMRYRGGFSEPIFEIRNWVNYDTLKRQF